MLKIFKALADETRLRLMGVLSQGDFNVNELLEILRMGQSRISRHLKILAESGLVTHRREGNWIYYGLQNPNGDFELKTAIGLAVKSAGTLETHNADLQNIESVVQHRRTLSTKYFNEIGSNWEALQRDMLDAEEYRRRAVELLPQDRETVVDLGVGSGLILPSLLKRFQKIIAVDASQTMLKIAANFISENVPERTEHCHFRLGELEHLPIEDNSADAAIASMVLHHVSNPLLAMQDAQRILQPGGSFVIADLFQHDMEEMRENFADLWLGFQPADLEKWLKRAGFRVKHSEVLDQSERLKVVLIKAQKPYASE